MSDPPHRNQVIDDTVVLAILRAPPERLREIAAQWGVSLPVARVWRGHGCKRALKLRAKFGLPPPAQRVPRFKVTEQTESVRSIARRVRREHA